MTRAAILEHRGRSDRDHAAFVRWNEIPRLKTIGSGIDGVAVEQAGDRDLGEVGIGKVAGSVREGMSEGTDQQVGVRIVAGLGIPERRSSSIDHAQHLSDRNAAGTWRWHEDRIDAVQGILDHQRMSPRHGVVPEVGTGEAAVGGTVDAGDHRRDSGSTIPRGQALATESLQIVAEFGLSKQITDFESACATKIDPEDANTVRKDIQSCVSSKPIAKRSDLACNIAMDAVETTKEDASNKILKQEEAYTKKICNEIIIGKTARLITEKDIRIGARPIQVKKTREKYSTPIE